MARQRNPVSSLVLDVHFPVKSDVPDLLIELDEERNPIRLPYCARDVTFACYVVGLEYASRSQWDFESTRQLDLSATAKRNHIPSCRCGMPVLNVTRREPNELRTGDFNSLGFFPRLRILCKRSRDGAQFFVNLFGMGLAVRTSVDSCHNNRCPLLRRHNSLLVRRHEKANNSGY